MYYLIALIMVAIFLLAGINYGKAKGSLPSEPNTITTTQSARNQFLSLKDIQKQLAIVAQTPPPAKLSFGAMCYTPAAAPFQKDYICPACGEKTIYSIENLKDSTEAIKIHRIIYGVLKIEECRRLIARIDKISINLDESGFCRHCSPKATEPRLGIVVNYPDDKLTHRYWNVTPDDLTLIEEFTNGKTVHTEFNDGEVPLKNQIDRIKDLLWVTDQEKNARFLSRQEIQDKLRQVAQSPAPQNLSFGAMCYEIAAAADRIDYICPVCSEKTVYASRRADEPGTEFNFNDYNTRRILEKLDTCRRIVQQITSVHITLDESQFCRKCSPSIQNPQLALIISYPQEKDSYRCIIGGKDNPDLIEDVNLIKAFLDGKAYYETAQDRQIAIKDCLPRLEKLLGITMSTIDTPKKD